MNQALVDRIVAATLYEGYILYPYRPTSVKNQVRWTFGGVFPRAYAAASGGSERSAVSTECLLRERGDAQVHVAARFLHPVTRTVLRLRQPRPEPEPADVAAAEPVAALELAGTRHLSWEEARERSIEAGPFAAGDLIEAGRSVSVTFPEGQEDEPLRDANGVTVGILRRRWERLDVTVTASAQRCGTDLCRVRARVGNDTEAGDLRRERALLHALVSAHAVLAVTGGAWLSLADPPEDARGAAADCVNDGVWPVLVGEAGVDDTVLASPIILEDHPQVAPESAGDLYDSTEIDEILSLRILTLTDGEKEEMRAADARARELLERTESLTEEQFMRLHGTLRELRPLAGDRP